MKNYIAGTFRNIEEADTAIDTLTDKGISMSQISVVTREDVAKNNIKVTDSEKGKDISKTAATGGVIGGALGLLAGIGAITIPGLGPLLFAGPIAAAFGLGAAASSTAAGAITGVLAGGLVGALKQFGLDETQAKAIEAKVKSGYVLLFVDVLNSDESKTVKDVMEMSAAEDVSELTYK